MQNFLLKKAFIIFNKNVEINSGCHGNHNGFNYFLVMKRLLHNKHWID